jgi:hypothetical protein
VDVDTPEIVLPQIEYVPVVCLTIPKHSSKCQLEDRIGNARPKIDSLILRQAIIYPLIDTTPAIARNTPSSLAPDSLYS